jgi:DNA-binding CsgD family transcriptional regulator
MALAQAQPRRVSVSQQPQAGGRETGGRKVAGKGSGRLAVALGDRAGLDWGSLGPETQNVLRAAAVLGSTFPVDLVADMLDIPLGRAMTLLDEAQAAGVVRREGDDIVFAQPDFQSAVYEDVPRAIRRAMHRQFGQILLARGGPPREVARHVCSGAEEGHRDGLVLLDQAVAELQSRDPEAAAQVATMALRLTPSGVTEEVRRCAVAVEALISAGKPPAAVETARRVLGHGCSPDQWSNRLHLSLALVALLQGDVGTAEREVDSAQTIPGMQEELRDETTRTKLLCDLISGDLDDACASAASVLAGDEQSSGSNATLSAALSVLAELAWEQGRAQDALTLAMAAVRRLNNEPVTGQHPRLRLALMHTSLGQLDAAQACIEDAGTEPRGPVDALWNPCPPLARARWALASGRVVEATREAESALGAARQMGTTMFAMQAATLLAQMALRRGDLRAAKELLVHRAGAPAGGWGQEATHAWGTLTLSEVLEGPDAALDEARALCASLRKRPHLLLEEATAAPSLTRLLRTAHDETLAGEVVAIVERLADANPGAPALQASRAHARALLDRDPQGLQSAAAVHVDPWAAASAWEDAGRLYGEQGDRARARTAFGEALDRYTSVDADRDGARVGARLRRLGVRNSHGRRKARPISGWDSLTESEQRVARVIAEGLTTAEAARRLFLSPHTVDSHVRHSFRKLGISSRVEMTRIVLLSDLRAS